MYIDSPIVILEIVMSIQEVNYEGLDVLLFLAHFKTYCQHHQQGTHTGVLTIFAFLFKIIFDKINTKALCLVAKS